MYREDVRIGKVVQKLTREDGNLLVTDTMDESLRHLIWTDEIYVLEIYTFLRLVSKNQAYNLALEHSGV